MSKIERLLIGAMGALSPVIATLITNDFIEVLQYAEPYETLGYCIRVLVLALVGMFVVYLYEDETNKMKVFQLGMAAPALFMATINGNHGNHRVEPEEEAVVWEDEVSTGSQPMLSEGQPAVSAQPEPPENRKEFAEMRSLRMSAQPMIETAPEAKPIQQFMHGLIRSGD